MAAFYIAVGGPDTRSYYRADWNEKSWWLPWHRDARTGQWLRTEVKGSPSPMPTPYRTLEDAETKRGELAATYVVFIVNATTHEQVDVLVPGRPGYLESMDADDRWYALNDGWVR